MLRKEASQSLEFNPDGVVPFYRRSEVHHEVVPIAGGIPFGIERVTNENGIAISGVFGTWGENYSNDEVMPLIEDLLQAKIARQDRLNLRELGFVYRHHTPDLDDDDGIQLERYIGSRAIQEAVSVNGWDLKEVDAILMGVTAPSTPRFLAEICDAAGLREDVLKVTLHKACDGAAAAAHLALNPQLGANEQIGWNVAQYLYGRKVLFGGFEGISRFLKPSEDKSAHQLFANGFGIVGMVPGINMRFVTGREHEHYDEEGVLAVRMYYDHSRSTHNKDTSVDVYSGHRQDGQEDENDIRLAGLMHEPDGGRPIDMAGPMGMVKLFVRQGVGVVQRVYRDMKLLEKSGQIPGVEVVSSVAHQANIKINAFKAKLLEKEGIHLPSAWDLAEFGNVVAASVPIAFLKRLPEMKLGQRILFDGFGAGTYYDSFIVDIVG